MLSNEPDYNAVVSLEKIEGRDEDRPGRITTKK
jgi:hypothetical protein